MIVPPASSLSIHPGHFDRAKGKVFHLLPYFAHLYHRVFDADLVHGGTDCGNLALFGGLSTQIVLHADSRSVLLQIVGSGCTIGKVLALIMRAKPCGNLHRSADRRDASMPLTATCHTSKGCDRTIP